MSTALTPPAGPEVLRPSYRRQDERGTFTEVVNAGPWETVITGAMRTGAVLGNHYHKLTRLFFYLTGGAATVTVKHVQSGAVRTATLHGGQGCYLETGEAHAICFEENSTFLVLKSQAYREDEPDIWPCQVIDTASAERTPGRGE